MVSRAIEREYGTTVAMEYIELANPATREKHKDIVELARKKYLRFPLIMIDGEVVFHGSLDYYSLMAVINRRLEELKKSKAGE